jgi:hypothetical protein
VGKVAERFAPPRQLGRLVAGVGPDRPGEGRRLALRQPLADVDVLEQQAQVAPRAAAGQGRLHGAALLVAQDHDEGRAQVHDRVLDQAEHDGVGDVAGDAEHEELAHALVEDQLGPGARVGAGQDQGEGPLALGRLGPVPGVVVAARPARREAGVAVLEALPGPGGGRPPGRGRGLWLLRRQGGEAQQDDERHTRQARHGSPSGRSGRGKRPSAAPGRGRRQPVALRSR